MSVILHISMRSAKSIDVSILFGSSLKYLQQNFVVTMLLSKCQYEAYLLYWTEVLQKLLTLC